MKTKDHYRYFKENGQKIAAIRDELVELAKNRETLENIDKKAEELIKQVGGEPAFKKVKGYHWSTCISVNEGFVHGIPKGTIKDGDVVTVDIGMYYKGTTTDTATTFVVGNSTPEVDVFLKTGREALKRAIRKAQPGNTVRDISQSLQTDIESAGYTVTRSLTGHGLGETMHEDPAIPCFVSNDPNLRVTIKPGMILAIEAMYMQGDWPLKLAKDGWTLNTADGSLSAMFEHDVYIKKSGPEIITQSPLESASKA